METKAKIIIGDSRQMKEVKNEEIDLIITSLLAYKRLRNSGTDWLRANPSRIFKGLVLRMERMLPSKG